MSPLNLAFEDDKALSKHMYSIAGTIIGLDG
jgi:hypothetical protein